MKANSIKPLPPCEQIQEASWRRELHPRRNGNSQNGGAPSHELDSTATSDHHQSARVQRFLLDISAEFVSRDYETTLKRLAHRAVPFIADFCFMDVLTANGTIQRVGHAHTDAMKHELFDKVQDFVPTLSWIDHPVCKVLRTGKPYFVPEITDGWMVAVATSEPHFELMRDLEVRSIICVPLLVASGTLGALTFCYSAISGRHYSQEDLWIAEDIARRAALVVENARLYHALEDAAQRKDEFLAMLGHELRNPLAPIRNAMQILRATGVTDTDVEEVTRMVDRQVLQLTRLVDDLLDVSRVGHGKINLQMTRVDLRDVVALAVEVSRPLIDARKHVFKVSIPQQPVDVEGDPGRLAQVVSNLLNNSAKYSDDGGQIELTLEVNGNEAVVLVRDAGIGIEQCMLPTIFDLFAQVKGSTGRSEQGLGIGLALVRNLTELHGGCVQATSAGLGHGTMFVVRLPLLTTRDAGDTPAQDRPNSAVNAPNRRILLVDDNKDAADSMAILLRLAGHDVKTAYDGQTALALATLEAPEVVICDISMPDMGGLELARRLRQDLGLKDSLLVALSGYARQEDRQRSQESGFNAHLAKPVRLESLRALIISEDFAAVACAGASTTPISAR